MKKILIIIIGIFVLVGSTYIVLFYNSEQLDRFPLSEKKIISEFEQFKSTNNKFPDDISKFFATYGFKRKIRFGFLSTEI